jgi:IS5 family transposase
MKMKLFEPLKLKFEDANWANNPEFGLVDTILEQHPELIKMVEPDIIGETKDSNFGRGDTPSVEQIVRAGLYKEMKGYDYRELEYAQEDSRICEQFVKIDPLRPYSFQVYQKYISKIKAETLEKLMVALNKIAIEEGLEDIKQFRQDSTVVETNIHYPTNNSLVWDCIKEADRLLTHLQEEVNTVDVEQYLKAAKKTYFKINMTKAEDKRAELFRKQLLRFTKCINQVSNIVKKSQNIA